MLQHSLDEAITRGIAAIERSGMPDLHKAAKRRKLRLRLEPYRPRRKRLTLQALYDEYGAPVSDEQAIGDLIAEVWSPVFARRDVDQERGGLIGHGRVGRSLEWRLRCRRQLQDRMDRMACPTRSGRMPARQQRNTSAMYQNTPRDAEVFRKVCWPHTLFSLRKQSTTTTLRWSCGAQLTTATDAHADIH